MSKRASEFQLTKDNYDDDTEHSMPSDGGYFKNADSETLKNRVIIKAKRRNLESNVDNNDSSLGVFSNFKGFSSFGNTSNNKFDFHFVSKFSNTSNPTFKFGSNDKNENNYNKDDKDDKSEENSKKAAISDLTSISESTSKNESKEKDNEMDMNQSIDNSVFYANLNKLNKNFFEVVQRHIVGTPRLVYDFTLVCEEYISKCKKIREKAKYEKSKSDQEKFLFDIKPTTDIKTTFDFTKSNSTIPFTMKNFVPMQKNDKKEEAGGDEGGEGDEEEQPPKVLSVEHNEADSVYTKKCKLYYKKDENFIEKGMGFLYVKINKDVNAKPQLLIRADTNTGNILLNIILSETLPIIKAENNKGILLTCVPNPPIEIKKDKKEEDKRSVTFLIRVKTTDCEELYQNLMKYKG